jgi:hypothetical protein
MMNLEPQIDGLSIVALGSFNPAIFHPRWFAANQLIRIEEADEAKVEFISPNYTTFEVGHFKFQVIQERLSIETSDSSTITPLKDLCVGTFAILEHTPIRAFGLNSNQHFSADSVDEWHHIGHYLTPKESWQKLMSNPGMESIAIRGRRESSAAQRVTIRIEPSTQCTNGVFVNINQHYELKSAEKLLEGGSSRDFLDALTKDWDGFLEYRSQAARTILTDALNAKVGSDGGSYSSAD